MFEVRGVKQEGAKRGYQENGGRGWMLGGYGYESGVETVTAYFRKWVSCFSGSGKEASVISENGKLSHSLKAHGRRSISMTSLLTRFKHTWISYASYDHGGGRDNPGLCHVPRRPTFRECSIRVISMAQLVCPVSDHILAKHTSSPSPRSCFLLYTTPCSVLFPLCTLHYSYPLGLLC